MIIKKLRLKVRNLEKLYKNYHHKIGQKKVPIDKLKRICEAIVPNPK